MKQKFSFILVLLLASNAASCTQIHYMEMASFQDISGFEDSEQAPAIPSTNKNRTLGALEGAGFGLASGSLLGIAVAASPGNCAPGDDLCSSSGSFEERFAYLGTGMMLSGALIGTLVGAIRGHRNVYKQSRWTVKASPKGAQIGAQF